MTTATLTLSDMRKAAHELSTAELARELAHARNARDAFSIGHVPADVAARVSVLVAEQHSRRARQQLAAEADAVIANALSSALEPETSFSVYRHYTGNSAYGPERWAVRETGQRDPVDIFRTESGARHAARILSAGGCHVEPHRPVGTRIQPD